MFEDFEKQKQEIQQLDLSIKKHAVSNSQRTIYNGALKQMLNSGHKEIMQKMEDFRIQYAKLKKAFHRFLALQK